MTFKRSSGILLHPTSLPGPYGIGDLGSQAYRFIDWLVFSGCRLWQILPLGPTGFGDSPYQCFSAFAGNPYLINPDELIREGLLNEDELGDRPDHQVTRVDFGRIIPWKLNILEQAYSRFVLKPEKHRTDFDYFCAENVSWLDDYALFMAIKEKYGGGSWEHWPAPLRNRDGHALAMAQNANSEGVRRYSFYQFLFYRQWNNLHAYAKSRGLQIIGDIPIFVAHDSADVWLHPELFFLNKAGLPSVVAGVPPDIFSPTGQLWGNPLYNWETHKQTAYAWWLQRIRTSLLTVDILRLDHFRGFAGYWEIPGENKTAEIGRWVAGPGADFFRALDRSLGDDLVTPETGLPIIAEDLGLITPDVVELRDAFRLPGMKVLQFGFTGPDNPFLPHNYLPHSIAYTGTHDNDTALGWLNSAPQNERQLALRYLFSDGSDFAWDLIRAVWSSVAVFAIAPMQDVLSLGGQARMNFPSKLGGNWEWRMQENDLNEELGAKLSNINYLYSRRNPD